VKIRVITLMQRATLIPMPARPLTRSVLGRLRISAPAISAILCLAAAVSLSLLAQPIPQKPARPGYFLAPTPIYSSNPQDSWNRIFNILFSRRFQVYMTTDFPESAPFDNSASDADLRVSTRLFERTEIGDRAIDPLYYPPYNSREGRLQLLEDPTDSEFMSAMQEALADNSPHSALARAWMQSDLWSAYDILSEPLFKEDRSMEREMRHAAALDALARLIRKVALTPEEIQSLPDNYSQAKNALALPDLFNPHSGWVQVQWFAEHAHDSEAGYRRFSRIFVKPVRTAKNTQKLLDGLRNPERDSTSSLDGAAILIQLILIDSQGKLTPAHLTSEVEFRLFEKNLDGSFKRTQIRVCEINRGLLLRQPESGGFVSEDENAQAFSGGYSFAAPGFAEGAATDKERPVVVKLRTRCMHCHGLDATSLMSFQMKMPPHLHAPAVKQLNPAKFDAADFALEQKQKFFKSLRAYF
jgi:hypothetical protein